MFIHVNLFKFIMVILFSVFIANEKLPLVSTWTFEFVDLKRDSRRTLLWSYYLSELNYVCLFFMEFDCTTVELISFLASF